MFAPKDLFDLEQTGHAGLFDGKEFAWEVLSEIKGYVADTVRPGIHSKVPEGSFVGDQVFIGEDCEIEPGVYIKGPAIIGNGCQIRHGAYLRESVIAGDGCVLGNSCEFKNVLLFNGCQVPHFSYVGDAIFGYRAHLGAGVKISNVRLVPGSVTVIHKGNAYDTGLRKFGALLGDHTDIGCNAVLNPGSVIGRGSMVYPNTSWRGVLESNMIAKNRAPVQVIEQRRPKG